MPNAQPKRIVCLSAEAVEILFELGCDDRIVGVTSFATHPAAARLKPKVSGFSTVNFKKIDALRPDLVITFSDVQAEAARELIRRGHPVLATNQRSLGEIFETILLIGRVVGAEVRALALASRMRKAIREVTQTEQRGPPPLVYFEEWNDPLISGIEWVSELVEAAGGHDIFAELRGQSRAPDRVVHNSEVIRRQPDIIIASWCGKKASFKEICERPGWQDIPAVRNSHLYEIDSADMLQPGPGLMRGFKQLRDIVQQVATKTATR